jgi:hypothetical protein
MNNILRSTIVSFIAIVVFVPLSIYVSLIAIGYSIFYLAKDLPTTIYNYIYNTNE